MLRAVYCAKESPTKNRLRSAGAPALPGLGDKYASALSGLFPPKNTGYKPVPQRRVPLPLWGWGTNPCQPYECGARFVATSVAYAFNAGTTPINAPRPTIAGTAHAITG